MTQRSVRSSRLFSDDVPLTSLTRSVVRVEYCQRHTQALASKFQPQLRDYRRRNLNNIRESMVNLPRVPTGIRILASILNASHRWRSRVAVVERDRAAFSVHPGARFKPASRGKSRTFAQSCKPPGISGLATASLAAPAVFRASPGAIVVREGGAVLSPDVRNCCEKVVQVLGPFHRT
jgi:hypothetical protein